MIKRQHVGIVASLIFSFLLAASSRALAAQPTSFTFTPTFQDPDPGKREWEKHGNGYVEKLPSGRVNNFKLYKAGVVNGLRGTMIEKVEEPGFFVFVADSEAARPEF